MATVLPSRFWRYHAMYPLLLFILLAFLFEMSDLDLITSDFFSILKTKREFSSIPGGLRA